MYGILHAHSTFSLHDSAQNPEELVLRAKEVGAKNVTLTPHVGANSVENLLRIGDEVVETIEKCIKEGKI